MVLKIHIVAFRVVPPCSLVGGWVPTYQTARCHSPEDQNMNLKFVFLMSCYCQLIFFLLMNFVISEHISTVFIVYSVNKATFCQLASVNIKNDIYENRYAILSHTLIPLPMGKLYIKL